MQADTQIVRFPGFQPASRLPELLECCQWNINVFRKNGQLTVPLAGLYACQRKLWCLSLFF